MTKYPKYQLRVSEELMEALQKAGPKKVKAILEAVFIKLATAPEGSTVSIEKARTHNSPFLPGNAAMDFQDVRPADQGRGKERIEQLIAANEAFLATHQSGATSSFTDGLRYALMVLQTAHKP